jgi:hypothetical protein
MRRKIAAKAFQPLHHLELRACPAGSALSSTSRTNTGERGSLCFTLVTLVVVCHLEAGSPETTLDVEALIRLAAVEYALVAADLRGDEVERLDDAQAKLLALLVFRDGDVLDMAH